MGTVLVTNAQQRKALSIVRSLGKEEIPSICCDVTGCNPTRFSKYSNKFYKHKEARSPEELINCYIDIISKENCEILIPVDDDSMEAVVNHSDELSKLCKFIVPDKDSFYTALYKHKAVELVNSIGVDCPLTVRPDNPESLWRDVSFMGFPLVIKPVKSSGARGIRIVHEKDDFMDTYMQVSKKYSFPLVQKYVRFKEKYDVCLMYDNKSRLKASFVQREIRHYPKEVGPSTVQESVCRKDLIDIALKIMEKIPWRGVVELEFLIDDKDRPVFMEINPRFWASLETAVLSGVNFPMLYYNIAKYGDCEVVSDYKKGIKTRWMWPGDLLYFLTSSNFRDMSPSFFSGKSKGINDDIFRVDDPFPMVGVILQSGYYLLRKEKRNFVIKRE